MAIMSVVVLLIIGNCAPHPLKSNDQEHLLLVLYHMHIFQYLIFVLSPYRLLLNHRTYKPLICIWIILPILLHLRFYTCHIAPLVFHPHYTIMVFMRLGSTQIVRNTKQHCCCFFRVCIYHCC